MKLQDRVVVITGSGNGIGEACARRFAADGAKVVVTDVEAKDVNRVASDLGTVGMPADISKEASVLAVAQLALNTYGKIDIWFSNAGFTGPKAPGDLQAPEIWESMWQLHVMSHVFAVRQILPSMLERGEGYLLQTSSRVALSTQVNRAAYSVTKHASLALAEWLAVHFRPKGIRVSCFCPGPMKTRLLLSDYPEDDRRVAIALAPWQVADLLVEAIDSERFLIQTGPLLGMNELAKKVEDYEGWIEEIGQTFYKEGEASR